MTASPRTHAGEAGAFVGPMHRIPERGEAAVKVRSASFIPARSSGLAPPRPAAHPAVARLDRCR